MTVFALQAVQSRRIGLVLCLCAGLLTQAGCVTNGSGVGTGSHAAMMTDGGQAIDTGWPFWPRRMRVHPLSQFVTDRATGKLLIEARIEFSDGYGHTCKAFGQIVIALHDADRSQFTAQEIAKWPEDLTDLDLNEVYFDDVTGTYLFRLEIQDITLPPESELRAIFHSADGMRLRAEYVIP